MDKLAEREQMAVAGVQPPSRNRKEQHTVAEIAVTTLGRLGTARQAIRETEPKKKAAKIRSKINRIKTLIIPAVGGRGIANLTEEDMEQFARGHTVGGKAPKKSTDRQSELSMAGDFVRCGRPWPHQEGTYGV